MTTNIKATNIEMTEPIKAYVEDKTNSLIKFFDNIQQIDAEVGTESAHHNKGKIFFAEMNVHVPKKLIRVRKNATNLYKAIDKVKDHLKIELEKLKGKLRGKDRGVLRGKKEYVL
jgi:putative sigma-54 modulation protein